MTYMNLARGRAPRAAAVLAVLAVVLLAALGSACVRVETGVNVRVDVATVPGTSAEFVPAECELRRLDAGAAGDIFTLAPGGPSVALVVSLLGSAGELPPQCEASHLPAWDLTDGAGTCTVTGSGYAARIAAASTARPGSTCKVQARVEKLKSNPVTFTVSTPPGAAGSAGSGS